MSTTPNLGLTVYSDSDNPTVKAWRDTINKDNDSSAFKVIDAFAGSVGRWQTWLPEYTGFATPPSSVTAKYGIVGDICFLIYRGYTAGISSGNMFYLSVPAPIVGKAYATLTYAKDGGVTKKNAGIVFADDVLQLITLDNGTSTSAWAITGDKTAYFEIFYQTTAH